MMIKSKSKSQKHAFTLSAGLLAGVVAGLVGPAGCSTGSGGTAGSACLETCTIGGEPAGFHYACYCNMEDDEEAPPNWVKDDDGLRCAESAELALDDPEIDIATCTGSGCDCKARCELKFSAEARAEGVPCEDTATTTTTTSGYETYNPTTTFPTTSSGTTGEFPQCGDWDPAANVLFDSGEYYIKWNFLNSVIESPYHLVVCDSARFELQTGGGFELHSATSSDLLYLLGLRNGDIPTELNGLPLDTLDDVLTAFGELWLNDGETVYTLTVARNNTSVSFDYSPWIAF